MDIDYIGEWTLLAWTGRFLVALAFASALAAVISFLKGWNDWGKRSFQIHAVSTFAVIALVFVSVWFPPL